MSHLRLDTRAAGLQLGRASRDLPSRTAALTLLGSVVYAIRVNGTIKIGHTTNLARRLNEIRCRDHDSAAEIIAFKLGSAHDEATLHHRLTRHLHHGREYYWPVSPVIDTVNEMREVLELPPIIV